MAATGGYLRIGELSRRVGVRPELLRAWEARYGLLSPSRSTGGFRLYSADDERRVRAMRANLDRGLSAAEAARVALEAPAEEPVPAMLKVDTGRVAAARDELRAALDVFDDAGANRALDAALAAFSTETVLREIVLPYLAELGERWSRGEASIAQEHFSSNLLRGRLLGLARGWGQGTGPRALLACVPGELHDLPLIVFGLALRARGWRAAYLGQDTPIATLVDAAEMLRPELVVVTASTEEAVTAVRDELRRVAVRWPLAVGGRGASAPGLDEIGARPLGRDPVEEADALSRTF